MYYIGDKFIIEIGGVFNAWSSCAEEWENDHDKTFYRIKGFDSLVIDGEGLKKLTQVSRYDNGREIIYMEGRNDKTTD